MKPVCDHPRYCKNDKAALYIGQTGHIAYPPHRNNNSYFPSGWPSISQQWSGLCSYTAKAKAKGVYALCNIPTTSHSWQPPSKGLGFICGTNAPTSMQWPSGFAARPDETRVSFCASFHT